MKKEIANLIQNYTVLCKNPIGNTMHLYNIEDFVIDKIKKEFDSRFWTDLGDRLKFTYVGCTIIFDSKKFEKETTIYDLEDDLVSN